MIQKALPEIHIPKRFNYIGAFLTFACQLRCTYCINHHGGDLFKKRRMSGEEWIRGLNRISTRDDLPITLQGGEPSVHKDFIPIVKGIRLPTPIDILTNLEREVSFWEQLEPTRLRRHSPYASIRVSYHHGQSDFGALTQRVGDLLKKGYSIGIWEVVHPEYSNEVFVRQQRAHSKGIDYRLKEFLGPYKGKDYGTMRYHDAVNSPLLRSCECRPSELLIGPAGNIFRCHSDLYANRCAVGHILDPEFNIDEMDKFLPCHVYGKCNACDIKIKTDRLQKYGHSSVEVRKVSKPILDATPIQDVFNTY